MTPTVPGQNEAEESGARVLAAPNVEGFPNGTGSGAQLAQPGFRLLRLTRAADRFQRQREQR